MEIKDIVKKLEKDLKFQESMYPKKGNITSQAFVGSKIGYINKLLQWVKEQIEE